VQLLSAPGGQIATWRNGSGLPALLIHGGPGISEYTEELADELQPMFDTIRYQQRGLAPTTLAGPYTVETHISDAIAVLDALGIERAWAIGHSWGGYLAMHLAVTHPDRLLGLIALDPLGAVGDGGLEAMRQRIKEQIPAEVLRKADELDELAKRGIDSDENAMESWRLVWPAYFADAAQVSKLPAIRMSYVCNANTWHSVSKHVEQNTLTKGLRSYKGRAIFIAGADSNLPVTASEESAALIPGATLTVIPDCGHFIWLEKPGAIARALAQSLSK
jgi:proline iminopeptidase